MKKSTIAEAAQRVVITPVYEWLAYGYSKIFFNA
jgi:hypothetical protein